ncbi:probable LRR receptor-like serine/threonine-protein kinase At3g47570 isoform X1 [Setaria italica]|uniref:probable LRR receptor-like serine/threonine-protein kinase At3g47570 isoform X1 n=1 Tax=Setaria italica TaxID=4555 RepID=UPI00035093B4|nr:probable LRR receptor-like serine/threonine-protein kinase At3g47570 isoform X1 [Setaria italica]
MSPHAMCVIFSSHMAFLILLSGAWKAAAAPTVNQTTYTADRKALLCIKSHLLTFKPASALTTWSNSSLDFCRWHGVWCSWRNGPTPRVVALRLEEEGLTGKIPACISNLTYLKHIHLPVNELSGPVPPELGNLGRLRYVNLSFNALSGVIPAELASCSGLRIIALKKNNLDGGIPTFLVNSSLIQKIDLRMNNLSGPIPPLLTTSYTSLKFLALTRNSLSGVIPSSLGNLSSLAVLIAAENQLTGGIPASLARLSNIQLLDLTYNNLSGTVPNSIYNLSSLTFLGIAGNSLVGTLPSNMGNTLPNIENLVISENNFQGEIPESLANATNLEIIHLAQNSFSGVIPSLGSLPNLHRLVLYQNRWLEAGDWMFLSSLTNCTQLAMLILDGNNLQGDLPSLVTDLSRSLEYLVLGSNHITGTIPTGIGNLVSLSMLYLDDNKITGPIPASIGNLHNLYTLDLSKNRFYGKIPTSFGNLGQLSELYLQENNLSGGIPAELAGCKNLLALNLSSNILSGPIPDGLFGKLNQLSWWLDLSHNQLTDSIPDDVGSFINLKSLNISNNNISGQIPSTLGSCELLQSLRLGGNFLEGQIPISLATLRGIEEVDFSQNDLSGDIPEFFELFNSLEYLNLSFNNLDGPIPTGGVFANATCRLFLQGNPSLCTTTHLLDFPLCANEHSERKTRTEVHVLAIVIPCGAISLLFVLFLKKRTSKDSRLVHESSKKLKIRSYYNLSKMTNEFSSANLIGSGQSSVVYKGSLPEEGGQMFAIKVFKLGQSGASKSFLAECRALRNIRHRNIVKVITACSTYDPLGNEFKALVLEYMSNGTLADHLHTKSPRYGCLSLGARIGIAVDVASVLEYLHIWCVPPMVHCDLKPSNILFDDDHLAHVGDFGLARFVLDFSSYGGYQNSTSLIGPRGSVGYIPPEYGMGSRISTEGDIYSYGIVLLEMLTGKHPTDELFDDGFTLHKYVEEALPHIAKILDPVLSKEIGMDHSSHTQSQEQGNITEVQKCILQLLNLGLICSEEAPKTRPNIQDVYSEVVEVKEHFLSCSMNET